MSIQLLSSRWWREIEALDYVMYKLEFYHLTSDGALTPCFIDSSHRSRDYRAAFNLIAVCAAYCKVRIIAFAIEDTHLHILMEGSYEDCMAFKIMFGRSRVPISIWIFSRLLMKTIFLILELTLWLNRQRMGKRCCPMITGGEQALCISGPTITFRSGATMKMVSCTTLFRPVL